MAPTATNVILDLEEGRSRKLLRDLKNYPFMAVVLYDDGSLKVFTKDMGPEEVDHLRDAFDPENIRRMIIGNDA